nr:hypothetical protein GCM10020092_027440 [Actinoplanes digitatis]
MRAVTRFAGNTVVAVAGVAAGAAFQAAPAAAATPTMPSLVAYVRSGDVYASKGATETRLTTGGGWSRPRFSPDGKSIALLKA